MIHIVSPKPTSNGSKSMRVAKKKNMPGRYTLQCPRGYLRQCIVYCPGLDDTHYVAYGKQLLAAKFSFGLSFPLPYWHFTVCTECKFSVKFPFYTLHWRWPNNTVNTCSSVMFCRLLKILLNKKLSILISAHRDMMRAFWMISLIQIVVGLEVR